MIRQTSTKKVRHVGQNESVYKAYAREGKEWVVQGVSGMRKKLEGPGEVLSDFQDEKRGLWFATNGRTAADELGPQHSRPRTPGQKSKGGFWGDPESEAQVEDMLDVHELLEPDLQVVCEVDHSSGHAR